MAAKLWLHVELVHFLVSLPGSITSDFNFSDSSETVAASSQRVFDENTPSSDDFNSIDEYISAGMNEYQPSSLW